MLNCFKSTDYLLKLTPQQVIGKLKAKTNSPNRLSNRNSEFKGVFKQNTFKLQFMGDGNILVHKSYNPVFVGKASQEKKGTHLNIKMQMNVAGYIMLLIPLFIWLVSLVCMFKSLEDSHIFIVTSSIILLGSLAIVFGISVSKYKEMRTSLEEIFKDEII